MLERKTTRKNTNAVRKLFKAVVQEQRGGQYRKQKKRTGREERKETWKKGGRRGCQSVGTVCCEEHRKVKNIDIKRLERVGDVSMSRKKHVFAVNHKMRTIGF